MSQKSFVTGQHPKFQQLFRKQMLKQDKGLVSLTTLVSEPISKL